MVIFNSYVSLPEGIQLWSIGLYMFICLMGTNGITFWCHHMWIAGESPI